MVTLGWFKRPSSCTYHNVAMEEEEKEKEEKEDLESPHNSILCSKSFEQHLHERQDRLKQTLTTYFLLIGGGISLLLLVLMLLMFAPRSEQTSNNTSERLTTDWKLASAGLKPPKLGLHCGRTADDARLLGCEFDLISYSWTPGVCYDRETDQEFRDWAWEQDREFGAFPFFRDKAGSERFADEIALSEAVGEKGYTSQEEHLGHCIFWVRRYERLLEGKGYITERGDTLEHAIHCSNSILERMKGEREIDMTELHSTFPIGFNTC